MVGLAAPSLASAAGGFAVRDGTAQVNLYGLLYAI